MRLLLCFCSLSKLTSLNHKHLNELHEQLKFELAVVWLSTSLRRALQNRSYPRPRVRCDPFHRPMLFNPNEADVVLEGDRRGNRRISLKSWSRMSSIGRSPADGRLLETLSPNNSPLGAVISVTPSVKARMASPGASGHSSDRNGYSEDASAGPEAPFRDEMAPRPLANAGYATVGMTGICGHQPSAANVGHHVERRSEENLVASPEHVGERVVNRCDKARGVERLGRELRDESTEDCRDQRGADAVSHHVAKEDSGLSVREGKGDLACLRIFRNLAR